MTYTLEDKKQALRVIKEECKKHDDGENCEFCPFSSSDNECLILDNDPCDWKIKEPSIKLLEE